MIEGGRFKTNLKKTVQKILFTKSRYSALKFKDVPLLIFFRHGTDFFLNIAEILTSKMNAKISKDIRRKMAKIMSQRAIVEELKILRRSISEIFFEVSRH